MSITESSSENSEPIARRTRSQILGPRFNSAQWCSCHGTSGEHFSDSESSFSPISYLETEFPFVT